MPSLQRLTVDISYQLRLETYWTYFHKVPRYVQPSAEVIRVGYGYLDNLRCLYVLPLV